MFTISDHFLQNDISISISSSQANKNPLIKRLITELKNLNPNNTTFSLYPDNKSSLTLYTDGSCVFRNLLAEQQTLSTTRLLTNTVTGAKTTVTDLPADTASACLLQQVTKQETFVTATKEATTEDLLSNLII